MCTAISHLGKRHYFGRNLDLEYAYTEQVVVTPRNFPLHFRCGLTVAHHYAMIGMATVSAGYPLYYEATNEKGLSIAALHFPDNAQYLPKVGNKTNIAPFELIPWVLAQCENGKQAKEMLENLNVWHLPFSRAFPLTPMHWLIADREKAIVAEPMADGLHIYENPLGVLTNSPPFPYHMHRISDFMHLQPGKPAMHLAGSACQYYSNGMGAMGLPGDFSSVSRFVRAVYVKENSITEDDDVSQFFHILGAVSMPRGSVYVGQHSEITRYSSCCDTGAGIYYYTSYTNSRIHGVNMRNCPLMGDQLFCYPLHTAEDIRLLN